MLNAAGIIFRSLQGRVLLLHRTDGTWDYPGGGAKGDEVAAQTAIREAFEETQYRPGHAGKFLLRRVRNGVDYTTFLYECDSEFVPGLSKEHTDYLWAHPGHVLGESIKARRDVRTDAEFNEADHPRDEDGKFGQGVGGASTTSALTSAKYVNGQWRTESGEEMPAHVRAIKIPPGYKDVKYNPDPAAMLVATSVSSKGKTQYHYSALHNAKAAEAKFSRIDELRQKLNDIKNQNDEQRKSKDPRVRSAADCLALIMSTGIRPGAEDTASSYKAEKQAFGATTLTSKHLYVKGSEVRLRFVGKKGVDLDLPVQDKAVAKMLVDRAVEAGPKGQLFDTSDGALRDYTHKLDGGGFKVKDFRTALGTNIAQSLAAKAKAPTNAKEYKKAVMEVAKEVSAKLGNTPSVALTAYIDPRVFLKWKAAAELK